MENKYIDITEIETDNYKLTISYNRTFFQISLSANELKILQSEIDKINGA